MNQAKAYDLVIYGASGFSGRLVSEYLLERVKAGDPLRWAIAGRSMSKLEVLRTEVGADDVDIIIADAADQASIDAMVGSTRVVLSTVGPYQAYGSPLVEACAKAGTDYLDLCGEPHWMRQMIDEQQATAQASGARLLLSCGFDSIPSELGVLFLQGLARQRYGKPMPRVRGRVVTFIGGPSGGSVTTGMAMRKAAGEDPKLAQLFQDPFALTPGFRGPDQPSGQDIGFEDDVGPVRPFVLGATDAKNVHRSNFLMGHPYGTDFIYDEMQVGEPPEGGPPAFDSLPKPGEGPGEDIMANGRFDIFYIGSNTSGQEVRVRVACSRDPGFGASSRMIVETALILAADRDLSAGFWTPGAAFRDKLIERLSHHAVMTFEAIESPTNPTVA